MDMCDCVLNINVASWHVLVELRQVLKIWNCFNTCFVGMGSCMSTVPLLLSDVVIDFMELWDTKVGDDICKGLFLKRSQWPPEAFALPGLRANAAFKPS